MSHTTPTDLNADARYLRMLADDLTKSRLPALSRVSVSFLSQAKPSELNQNALRLREIAERIAPNNYAADAAARNNSQLTGRAAYEASTVACPTYENGDPRPSWDELDDAARWSWSRPTQRP